MPVAGVFTWVGWGGDYNRLGLFQVRLNSSAEAEEVSLLRWTVRLVNTFCQSLRAVLCAPAEPSRGVHAGGRASSRRVRRSLFVRHPSRAGGTRWAHTHSCQVIPRKAVLAPNLAGVRNLHKTRRGLRGKAQSRRGQARRERAKPWGCCAD